MRAFPRLRDCGNHLLDCLPSEEYDSLSPRLRHTSWKLKDVVQEYGAEVGFVHFPTTALVSLLTIMEEEDPVEAMTMGREGMVGISAALGVPKSPNRAICQLNGETLRLSIGDLRSAMTRGPALARLVHLYAAYSLQVIAQGLACNALHLLDARACRWILAIHDQANKDEFPLTQEFLAFMLGMRRQGVTVIAGGLQNAGIIAYRRGMVTVLDRASLEESACECYATTRAYYDRVFG
jgi:CRP-like cAMP-binding protein